MKTTTSEHARWALLPAILLVAACSEGPPADRHRAARTEQPIELATVDTLLPVGGTRLYVRGAGTDRDAAPVLVLHGGPLLDHGYVKRAFRPLHEQLAFVYFDQRLSGRSEGVVDSNSVRLDTLVHDIEGVRTGLDLGAVHVIGHSWGGLLALKYALEHPAEVRSLVLVSPMPPSTALWREEQRLSAETLTPRDTAGMGAIRDSEALTAGDPRAIERLLRLSFRRAFTDGARAEELSFHIEPDYQERSRQFAYLSGDLAAYDLTGELPELFIPTLVVYGADEAGAQIGTESLSGLPCVRFARIPASGHFPFIEQPRLFAETLLRFYEEVARGSGTCEGDR